MSTITFWLEHSVWFQIVILIASIFAGTLGALLGLGGGILLIPALTIGLGVPIHYAVGASIVSVIGTSSGAAASYVRDHLTNVRLAVFLEVATTTGALCGAVLSAFLNPQFLFLIFAVVLLQSAWFMWRRPHHRKKTLNIKSSFAKHLALDSTYPDFQSGKTIAYQVERPGLGFGIMYIAGLLSGLLGIGSGVLKVLAMDTGMKVPIKVSSATSNFMIGVTAAASADAYYMRGDILPDIAAPVALGVLTGAWIGARWMTKIPAQKLRRAFIGILIILALQMAYRGAEGLWNH